MGEVTSFYNVLVVLAVTLGSLTYGYNAAILGNTFSKPAFYTYEKLDPTGPGEAHTGTLIALWNALTYVGGFFGCLILFPVLSSRFGRKMPLAVASVLVILGTGLTSGEINPAMLAAGRVIQGLGAGIFLPGCAIYPAEVAPAHSRGLLVGLHVAVIGLGFAVAEWIGAAFFYVHGQVDWRVPLAIEAGPSSLLLCIIYFLPESPRWLYMKGRVEEAEKTMVSLHTDKRDPISSYPHDEYLSMRRQIDLEASKDQSLWTGLKDPHIRKRFIVGFLSVTGSQASGSIVILTYSSVIYTGLGFSPFKVVILTGIWTTLLTIGDFIGGWLTDKIGRVRQFLIGLGGCLLCLVMCTILSALYAGTDHEGGQRATVFFIFLFVCFYAVGIEAPSFVYTAEIFPAAYRSAGIGFSISAVQLWSAILNGSASIAFARISWKFYLVFVCSTFVIMIIMFLYFPETKGYSLEQVAQAFGDTIVEELDGDPDFTKDGTFEKGVGHSQHEVADV